ncbi:hypothetical protein Taro_047566 [Colocasia esculenta]|uniref:Uncharacterized protein n=1 Tax=Colocasia esculenta TaxID=4460 RepID=A0A843X142_COLES|nr:hypothetical protein [Colocasia esculenta]
MFTSNRAPQRDGKAPASPVPPSPPAPQAPPSPSTYNPDYWKGFYIRWNMALQKASRLYHHKGLTNILLDIGSRAEHICSSPSSGPSPGRSSSSPSASTYPFLLSPPSPARSSSSSPPIPTHSSSPPLPSRPFLLLPSLHHQYPFSTTDCIRYERPCALKYSLMKWRASFAHT